MACRTCRQSAWASVSARVRPPEARPDIVSADQFLLRTPGSGCRVTDMADLSSVRSAGHLQFNPTAQPMGLDPVRTAATKRRTPPAPSVRPCVRSAGHGQPRGLHVLVLTGQDGNAHAPFGNPSRYQHRDPSVVTPAPVLDAGTSASLVPVRCPRGRVRRPRWTPRSDRLPDTACPVVFGRTPSTPPGTPWRTGSDADRERTNGTEGVRHPRSPHHKAACQDTPSPTCGAGACGLATKVGSAMARLPA
jgi:hypothetical protein